MQYVGLILKNATGRRLGSSLADVLASEANPTTYRSALHLNRVSVRSSWRKRTMTKAMMMMMMGEVEDEMDLHSDSISAWSAIC